MCSEKCRWWSVFSMVCAVRGGEKGPRKTCSLFGGAEIVCLLSFSLLILKYKKLRQLKRKYLKVLVHLIV